MWPRPDAESDVANAVGASSTAVRVPLSPSAKRSGRCISAVAGCDSGTGHPVCPDPHGLHHVPADMTAASTIWMSGG